MKAIEKIEKFVACVCVLIMALLVFSNVIARYAFNSPLAFSDEISSYLFILMSFMGTAIAARRKAHLGLSIVTDRLSPGAARTLSMVMYAVSAVFCLLVVIFGIQMVLSQYALGQETATMQWPEWIYGLFVPVGAGFAMISFVDGIVRMAKEAPEDAVFSGEGKGEK
ncbi:MAG: TRAP transporter small permease [Butyricicoccus sp.]